MFAWSAWWRPPLPDRVHAQAEPRIPQWEAVQSAAGPRRQPSTEDESVQTSSASYPSCRDLRLHGCGSTGPHLVSLGAGGPTPAASRYDLDRYHAKPKTDVDRWSDHRL